MTNAQLSSAISGTSNNSNAIATLDTPFADPDAESMRQRFNELVLALRSHAEHGSDHVDGAEPPAPEPRRRNP